jgi:hypothetical protein
MPWDTSLNKDLHDAIKYHVAATANFRKADTRRFDMTTPKRGTEAYRRVLQVYPLPEWVIQDVDKVFLSLKMVWDTKGIKVDGVRNSPGRCHVKSSTPHGGYHPQKQGYDDYGEKALHEDVKVGNTVKLEHSVNRAEGKETVGNQKWVKKEASPPRPNEKRTRPTENEAENEEGKEEEKEEMTSEMPKSPPRQKRTARLHTISITK